MLEKSGNESCVCVRVSALSLPLFIYHGYFQQAISCQQNEYRKSIQRQQQTADAGREKRTAQHNCLLLSMVWSRWCWYDSVKYMRCAFHTVHCLKCVLCYCDKVHENCVARILSRLRSTTFENNLIAPRVYHYVI